MRLAADPECVDKFATVLSVQGVVEKKSAEEHSWTKVDQDSPLCADESIRTQKNSRATIEIINQTIVRLDENTTLLLSRQEGQSFYDWLIDLLSGKIFLRSREPHHLKVNTPFINAAHQGTEFMVAVESDRASVMVLDGQVAADNAFGRVMVNKGQQAIALKGQAPQVKPIKISPEDAVQWLLYYPLILEEQATEKEPSDTGAADAFNQQAAALLNMGRVDEAQVAIDQAKVLSPDNAKSLSLEAIVAIAKNRSDQALGLASHAVKQDPKSVAAKIALSYALQAKFQLEEALQTMEQAVRQKPDHALAWARIAELQLSTGDHDTALVSAQKAQTLNPLLARTQIILGFAALAQAGIEDAQQAFEHAIELDANDPLARLGLGLAKIRQGKVEAGTRDMEAAVSLDPNNAVLRSYLGKAYYELKNTDYATTELAIGKEQDSKDPTPWFYDAILKQTTNRPVEALHDMQKAIELNDNRAVYRSNLLLDDDLAARSASLGRIYNDLGFQQRGLVEGWKSVNTAPSNYSAHRLLADNYASLRRHETARVSELLQSQLLQPANVTPIQPRLAESNLLILDGLGPSIPSFNEFNPLFAKNRLALQASGIVAGNNTYGDEVVVSGLKNNLSYSLGQYHYETDGFRPNNDLEQNIYSGFMQYQFTPNFSAQVEGRYNEFESGDLAIHFQPVEDTDERTHSRTYFGRLGLHYEPIKNNHLLASVIYNDADQRQKDSIVIDQSYTAEGQYLFDSDNINIIVGGGHYHSYGEAKFLRASNQIFPDLNNPEEFGDINIVGGFEGQPLNQDESQSNGYVYAYVKPWQNLMATFGLSMDAYQTMGFQRNQINPKFGINWQILPSTLIRAAAFQSVKRALSSNQTLEPTQVASFNQFFDDFNGAKTKRYGLAIDHQYNPSMFAGLEASLREIDYPVRLSDEILKVEFTDREQLFRTYFLWTPIPSVAFKAAYSYERIKHNPVKDEPQQPVKINTHRLPITLNYFHPGGFFGKLGATFVEQNVKYLSDVIDSPQPGNDHFWIIDAAIGYRLPNRWGIASFGVKNLLNKKFKFEDINTQNGKAVAAQFQPDRVIFGQITLSY